MGDLLFAIGFALLLFLLKSNNKKKQDSSRKPDMTSPVKRPVVQEVKSLSSFKARPVPLPSVRQWEAESELRNQSPNEDWEDDDDDDDWEDDDDDDEDWEDDEDDEWEEQEEPNPVSAPLSRPIEIVTKDSFAQKASSWTSSWDSRDPNEEDKNYISKLGYKPSYAKNILDKQHSLKDKMLIHELFSPPRAYRDHDAL